MRRFRIKTTAGVAGLLAIAAVIVMADAHLRHSGISAAEHFNARATTASDPLERELLRCRAIGIAAKDDAACEAAWAENRRRFFTPSSDASSVTPSPDGRPPR